eukprot:TRINITY_DN4191_c0_g1_i1.p1 TRINITY_DN4191_c0_g1~~TRINITY_DN4191_c0_g1_i1.p1  ORF type:complete len:430 (+),score=108.00 TRINITY_DN4191_c0_g1_i1:42-1292(+)
MPGARRSKRTSPEPEPKPDGRKRKGDTARKEDEAPPAKRKPPNSPIVLRSAVLAHLFVTEPGVSAAATANWVDADVSRRRPAKDAHAEKRKSEKGQRTNEDAKKGEKKGSESDRRKAEEKDAGKGKRKALATEAEKKKIKEKAEQEKQEKAEAKALERERKAKEKKEKEEKEREKEREREREREREKAREKEKKKAEKVREKEIKEAEAREKEEAKREKEKERRKKESENATEKPKEDGLKEQGKQSKKANANQQQKVSGETLGPAEVKAGERQVRRNLLATDFTEVEPVPATKSAATPDKVTITQQFTHPDWQSFEIFMPPKSYLPATFSEGFELQGFVVQGMGYVSIHEYEFLAKEGFAFLVPPFNYYCLTTSDEPLRIHIVKSRSTAAAAAAAERPGERREQPKRAAKRADGK